MFSVESQQKSRSPGVVQIPMFLVTLAITLPAACGDRTASISLDSQARARKQAAFYSQNMVFDDAIEPIRVCFVNSGPIIVARHDFRDWLRYALAITWEKYSQVRFEIVDGTCSDYYEPGLPLHPDTNTPVVDAEPCVRVWVQPNSSRRSRVTSLDINGIHYGPASCFQLPGEADYDGDGVSERRQHNVFFGRSPSDWRRVSTIAHEFGHVLGLLHEQDRDHEQGVPVCDEYVNLAPVDASTGGTDIDPYSVMNYCRQRAGYAGSFVDEDGNPMPSFWRVIPSDGSEHLSPGDRAIIAELYGSRTIANDAPTNLRFEPNQSDTTRGRLLWATSFAARTHGSYEIEMREGFSDAPEAEDDWVMIQRYEYVATMRMDHTQYMPSLEAHRDLYDLERCKFRYYRVRTLTEQMDRSPWSAPLAVRIDDGSCDQRPILRLKSTTARQTEPFYVANEALAEIGVTFDLEVDAPYWQDIRIPYEISPLTTATPGSYMYRSRQESDFHIATQPREGAPTAVGQQGYMTLFEGATKARFTIYINADLLEEETESIQLDLGQPEYADIVGPLSVTVDVLDLPRYTFSVEVTGLGSSETVTVRAQVANVLGQFGVQATRGPSPAVTEVGVLPPGRLRLTASDAPAGKYCHWQPPGPSGGSTARGVMRENLTGTLECLHYARLRIRVNGLWPWGRPLTVSSPCRHASSPHVFYGRLSDGGWGFRWGRPVSQEQSCYNGIQGGWWSIRIEQQPAVQQCVIERSGSDFESGRYPRHGSGSRSDVTINCGFFGARGAQHGSTE